MNKVYGSKRRKRELKLPTKRLFIILIVLVVIFVALLGQIARLQFIEGEYLKQKKYSQTIQSTVISAKRGTIFDSNGKALAISANVNTVTVNPEYLKYNVKSKKDDSVVNAMKEKLAKEFSDIFELNYDEVLAKLNSEKNTETIASKVEDDKVDELRKWMTANKITSGINIDDDTKRYYPYNNLASNLIGVCGTDNQGLDGVELQYDSVLKGTNGKITTSTSVSDEAIPDSDEKYVAPQNGSDVYLTIDSNVQSIAEKYLKQAVEENKCSRGGNVIIENPTTGEILAMATYPDFNLNSPYEPNQTMIDNGYNNLSDTEKNKQILAMWRNRAVLDTYEPGSTFKIIPASAALEENITETDVSGEFYCNGAQQVANVKIRCAHSSGHGYQSLRQAIENSCNPAFIQLGQKIGVSTFYKYIRNYGFLDKTGIDLPSEGTSTFWSEENVGAVELATMSFGQRFTITPMQLVKAASAIANDGVMVTPHVAKKIINNDTGDTQNTETNVERQVISKETSTQMKDMMKDVVEKGGGTYAKVEGYTIGGKTGTSEADPNHPENGYVASFLAIAPVENTKLVVLLTLYGPQGESHFGGKIAAPVVSQILTEVLPYLNIPSNDSETTVTNNKVTIPNLTNKTVTEAESIIKGLGLNYETSASGEEIVTDQMPKNGSTVVKDGVVVLYTGNNDTRVSQTVPDLKNVSYDVAKNMLKAKKLNISSTGTGIVVSQEPAAGTAVDEGTIINVTLKEKSTTSQN